VLGGEQLVEDEQERHRRDDGENKAQPIDQLTPQRRFVGRLVVGSYHEPRAPP
jgi:hypothetical protein